MKKIFSLIILTLYLGLQVMAQAGLQLQYRLCTQCPNGDTGNGPFTYEAVLPYESRHIESDYDMRVTNGTRFHQGIDYLPRAGCRGDAILAVEGGTISLLNAGTGLKSIAVTNGTHAFVYMHIFRNGAADGMRSGDFVLKRLDDGSAFAIINLETGIAYSTAHNNTVTYGNTSYATQNTVVAGNMIAPIGNSGIPDVHLHLSLIEDVSANMPPPAGGRDAARSIDPWTEVSHDSNGFNQRIRTRANGNFALNTCEHPGPGTDAWGQIIPSYSNNTKNCIEIEVEMAGATAVDTDPNTPGVQADNSRYSNTVMDQEEVELEIRNTDYGAFERARGSNYESRFVINPVGNKTLYPSTIYNTYGSPTVNGISPFTYRDGVGFHPHDYYFIADFYTRLHKSDNLLPDTKHKLAFFPWDAKYGDGNYQMRSRVLDVDGSPAYTMPNPVDFDIDNFKPFIHGAEVFFEGPHVRAYRCYWEALNASSSKLKLGAHEEGGIPDLSTAGNLIVFGIASEALQQGTVTAEIPSLSTGQVIGNLEAGTDGKKWRFNFGSTFNPPLAYGQCHKIIFRGKDLNNNDLLDFQIPEPNHCNWGITQKPVVPKRDGANSWDDTTPTAKDEVHRFRILECGPQLAPDLPESTDPCLTAEQVDADIHYATAGQSDGAIYLTISGNTSGISVTWYDEEYNQVGSGLSLENVPAGQYCYEIKDICCLLSECYEIKECMLNVTGTVHHPVNGQSNGIILVTATGGGDTYTYHWSNGLASTSYQFNLGPGTYTVTVTDEFHCEAVKPFTLRDCSQNPIQMYSDVTHESSPGSGNGSIDLVIESGVSPFTYQWSGPNNFSSAQQDISGLVPGQYCVTITDAIGCTAPHCAIVNPCDPIIAAGTGIDCPYNQGGYMWLTLQGPGPFSVKWSDGLGQSTYGPQYQRNNLTPGVYCVTVTNPSGCSEVLCRSIASPVQPILIEGQVQNTTCRQANGSIVLSVTGGYSPYTYTWNDAVTTKDRYNLVYGTYCVTVSDNNGCTQTACFTLTDQSTNLKVAIAGLTMINDCFEMFSDCDGAINIEPVNGVAPFTYSWTGPNSFISNQQDISNLCTPGTYRITITDAYGCTATDQIGICCCYSGEPGHHGGAEPNTCNFSPITISGSVAPAQGAQGGSINLYVYSGGSGSDYSLIWKKNGVFYSYQKNITNLTPGQYCVTVDNGCSSLTKCFTIVDCNQTQINISGSTEPACPNYAAGYVNISVSGGTAPHTYKWSNGSTNQNLSQLTAGNYTVTVTDKNGCTAVKSFTVNAQQLVPVNQGCTTYTYCGNQVVNVQQFTENWEVDPFDCRRMRVVCANGYQGPWVVVQPTLVYPFGPTACVIQAICANGQIFYEYDGYTDIGLIGGIDQCGVPYCAYVSFCVYPELGGYDPNSIQLTGQYGTITKGEYVGSGCNVPLSCNPPSTCCRWRYYCEGSYIGVGVGWCQAVAPPDDPDALPNRESLIQALEAQYPNLKQINVKNIVDLEAGKQPDQRAAFLLAGDDTASPLKVYPNPFNDYLTVEINAEQKYSTTFSLYDITGRLLLQQPTEIELGQNKIELKIKADYPPGTYVFKYKNEVEKTIARLLVKLAH